MLKEILSNPLRKGIFFASFVLIIVMMTSISSTGCSKKKEVKNANPPAPEQKGEFVLLGNRGSIFDASLNVMKSSDEYEKNADGIFSKMKVGDKDIDVEIDTGNAYACSYVDGRRVVFYPLKEIIPPEKGEKKPFGFLHYFDEKGMSIFFHVVVELPLEEEKLIDSTDTFPSSQYKVVFLSRDEESYGLVRSRILNKSELEQEEAFRKFNSSRRTVLMGTNTLDQNKFLFIFLKIPSWDDRIFQIYQRWY